MPLNRKTHDGFPVMFVQGNEAFVHGAIAAGCRFFAGYPITPSTEIAEGMAAELPKVGGVFVQMEDEIASIAAAIGASAAGSKAMTATSGPGFSLMQENIGYAYMVELPVVVVNVQRGGPSTGLPTQLAQSDTMQARWGTHGDYTAIVLAPMNVQECYDIMFKAFNFAIKYSTPVIVLADELIGHTREKLILRPPAGIKILERKLPDVPPEWYIPYAVTPDFISRPAPFGRGFRYSITGLTHDQAGFPTQVAWEIKAKLEKLRKKIEMHCADMWEWREYSTEDIKYLIIAYGSAARSAKSALDVLCNKHKVKIGMMELHTIWPFPDKPLQKILERNNIRVVFVVENNMGQLIHPVREVLERRHEAIGINRYDGRTLEPEEIVDQVKEAIYG